MMNGKNLYLFYVFTIYLFLLLLSPFIVLLYFTHSRVKKEINQRVFNLKNIAVNSDESLPTIWFHASSIGEMKLSMQLIKALQKKTKANVILSVFTATAYEMGKEYKNLNGFFLLPLDLPFLMNRLVKKINPDFLFTVESEFWPVLVNTVKKNGGEVILVNGRISEKAYKNHTKNPLFLKTTLSFYDSCLMRSDEDAQRIGDFIDKKKVKVLGNIKYSVETINKGEKPYFYLSDNSYITFISTREGEEELLLNAMVKKGKKILDNKKVKIIIAPRHIIRVPEIEELLKSLELPYIKFSEKTLPHEDYEIVLVDIFGVLMDCLSISQGAFIGGSLVEKGGQNLLEPISQGIPIVFGNDMSNFQEEADFFLQHGAEMCQTAGEVIDVFEEWTLSPEKAKAKGATLQKALETKSNTIEKYVQEITALLPSK
ncbi:MAG: hypothetical protein HQK84_00765 [Nitrospinae bacterium]|nr:hypothetical protein [Nitrospinota bacterium]